MIADLYSCWKCHAVVALEPPGSPNEELLECPGCGDEGTFVEITGVSNIEP